jgi:serine/threonine protein kinase
VTASIGEERRRYGEYDIESLLGKGSIGKVYLARHRRIGRKVALKTIHLEQRFEDDVDESEFYRRLQREAEVCGALQHPNIVTLYDVGYENDIVSYLATEYVDGESLLARVKRSRPLPLAEALSISRDLLRGLAYAHGKGVIHRDIKPANILLTSGGEAKLADFGIARPLNSSLTGTNSLLGTPSYMSPEQVKSAPVTPRSDLFSVGVVMYEMLTGVKPFASPQLSGILFNVVNHEPPPFTSLAGWWRS